MSREVKLKYSTPKNWFDAIFATDDSIERNAAQVEFWKVVSDFSPLESVPPFQDIQEKTKIFNNLQAHMSVFQRVHGQKTSWTEDALADAEKILNAIAYVQARDDKSSSEVQKYKVPGHEDKAATVPAEQPMEDPSQAQEPPRKVSHLPLLLMVGAAGLLLLWRHK